MQERPAQVFPESITSFSPDVETSVSAPVSASPENDRIQETTMNAKKQSVLLSISVCMILLFAVPVWPDRDQQSVRIDDHGPACNRLFIMPTAFPMYRGEIQLGNRPSVGVTERFSIGTWFPFGLGGLLYGQYTVLDAPDSAVSVGSLAGGALLAGGFLFPLYCSASWGTPENSATASLALSAGFLNIVHGGGSLPYKSLEEESFWDYFGVMVMVGGKKALTHRISLITENVVMWNQRVKYGEFPAGTPPEDRETIRQYIHWDSVPNLIIPSVGLRFAWVRFSFDLGVVLLWDLGNSEDVVVRQGGEVAAIYYQNTEYGAGGVFPFPIASFDWRIQRPRRQSRSSAN
jgi:hypothetical protein